MTIRARILLLGLLSLLGILSVLASHVLREVREIYGRTAVLENIHLIERLSGLVDELQKERGLSAGFLGGHDATGTMLEAQRQVSDRHLAELGGALDRMSGGLGELNQRRRSISARAETPGQSFRYYSAMILDILRGIETVAKKTNSQTLQDRLLAHSHLLLAKDYVGQMRATLMEGLAARRFDNLALAQLGRLQGLQEFHQQSAINQSPPELATEIQTAYADPRMRAALERVSMTIHQPRRTLDGETAEHWFAVATMAIDALKTVERTALAEINRRATEESANAKGRLILVVAGTSLFAALLLWLALSSTHRILKAIDILLAGVEQVVTTRDFAHRIPYYSYDEMGRLSHSFNELLDICEKLIHEQEVIASTDALTGACNRYKFRELFARSLAHEQRYGDGMALIFMDVDYFKQINDCNGHDVGDAVLVELVKVIHGQTRSTDLVARWGGEEFVILVPRGGAAAAKALAENIRASIANHRFPGVGKVTVSLGVSAYIPGDTLESLCQRADYALYHAKTEGRNRVCIRLAAAPNDPPAASAQITAPDVNTKSA